jgi:hypothetical protein
MTHTYFVNIRKAQGDGEAAGGKVFFDLVYLATDISLLSVFRS